MKNETRKRIARENNEVCHICGEKIYYELDYMHPLSCEIDHVIPKAIGGTNDFGNLKPAHKKCNQQKGASCFLSKSMKIVSSGW